MYKFSSKDVYFEDGKRVLEIDILPEKYCNFDCIFCPIKRSKNKTDKQQTFGSSKDILKDLSSKIEQTSPDLIFINSKGESFINSSLEDIIDFVQSKNLKVRLLSNGYLLNSYKEIANKCDEVIGELKVVTEQDFQKAQRPLDGYSLNDYVSNMVVFRKQYNGNFIFEITLIKGYSDSEKSVLKMKKIIDEIAPNKVILNKIEDDIFIKKLGISDEKFAEILEVLLESRGV